MKGYYPNRKLLTDRQKSILELSVKGFSDYHISRRLKINPTVVKHLRIKALGKIERVKADLAFYESLKNNVEKKGDKIFNITRQYKPNLPKRRFFQLDTTGRGTLWILIHGYMGITSMCFLSHTIGKCH